MAADGTEPLPSTPEEYAADIDKEEKKWSAIVEARHEARSNPVRTSGLE